MLTIEECRQVLGDTGKDLTDDQVRDIRDAIYGICGSVLNDHFKID